MRCLLVILTACGRIGFDASSAEDAPFASCTSAPVCGPSGTSSCCDSLPVPGGTYYRAYDVAGDGMFADMSNPATVSQFGLDKYDISVGRFRAFVAAGMGTQASPPPAGGGAHAAIANSGWDPTWNASLGADTTALLANIASCGAIGTWTAEPDGSEGRPMNCISWFEAMAFCVWDGGYLPTDAEWNFAAAGGAEQRAFEWSSPPGDITVDASYASYECLGDGTGSCSVTDLTVVGSKPAGDGKWGQSDLGGNVYAWLLDSGGTVVFINPCVDCASVDDTGERIARGGSYRDALGEMRVGVRSSFDESVRADVFGARCARLP
jgi:formylglycine-generating enzyme